MPPTCHGAGTLRPPPGFSRPTSRRLMSDPSPHEAPEADDFERDDSPSGSYEAGGHGAVPPDSPLAGGPGAEDGKELPDGTTIARLERREEGS